jgi:SAM-dependent methyltransferase
MDLVEVSRIYTAYKRASIDCTIASDDLMWHSGKDFYYSVGESGLLAVLHSLGFSWLSSVQRILDLPCGHGRVARHLRAAFPNAEIFFSDLDESGVDFCASQFAGEGVYSEQELTKAALPGNLDVIWIGSLFTHVDEARTERWLRYLVSHLSSSGILVATLHGLWSAEQQKLHPMINPQSWSEILVQYRQTGFGYAKYTEHDMGDYGVSLSHPSKILQIASTIPDSRIVCYTERGWANNHDVLTISRLDRYRPF